MQDVEAGSSESFRTPKKNKNGPRSCTDLDEFDMCAIRKTINDFYITEKTANCKKSTSA